MSEDWLSSLRSLSRGIHDSLKPVLEMQRKLSEMQEISRQIGEFYRGIADAVRGIADAVEKLPEGTRRALVLLGRHGWYISLRMPMSAFFELGSQIQRGNCAETDQWMINFYESNVEFIKNDIQNKFPHRSQILECAFGAHTRGEYELSVPVLLAQADGICHELIGVQLYSRRDGQPRTSDFVEQLTINALTAALMEPLRVPLPISASVADRQSADYPSSSLNRHQILHGEVVDYATQTNSCKAISLLWYVATILQRDFFGLEED